MPRAYEMTWVGPPRAYWRKVYRGKVYTISCRELGVEKTKEGSYQVANAWWQQKKAEIDTASLPVRRPALPLEDLVAACEGKESGILDRRDVVKIHFRHHMRKAREYSEHEALLDAREEIEEDAYEDRLPADPDASRREAIRLAVGELLVKHFVDGEPFPEHFARILPAARVQQVEASLVELRGESSAPADRTVKHFNGSWLERKKLEVCVDRYTHYVRRMNHFLSFVGPDTDVKTLNGLTLDNFYTFCRQKAADPEGWSSTWARDTFTTTKAFFGWLVSIEAIEPLRNINTRFPFDTQPPEPVPWADEEIHTALGLANEKMQLFILLALNCGMGQKDIADIRASEIDWTGGTITRFRSKARKYTNRRKVSYPLWSATLTLLAKYNSGQEQVLLSEKGKPLWSNNRLDLISNQFRELRQKIHKKRPSFCRTFYDLRATGAYRIEEQFGRELADLYTAHAAKGVTELHYTNALQKRLNEAVCRLGEHLGLTNPPAGMNS